MAIHRLLLLLVLLMFCSCSTDPQTHRTRFMLMTQSKEIEVGAKAFRQFLSDPRIVIVTGTSAERRVSQVFDRLVNAAKHTAYADQAKQYEWEVVLVDNHDKTNSFSFPGDKVGVYTGLVSSAENDEELAGAIGHNVATILARHGGERMSQSIVNQIMRLGSLEASDAAPEVDPRQQEEADRLGILLAADAGYDPDEAFAMCVKIIGPGPRLEALRGNLGEAKEHYDRARSRQADPIGAK